MNLEVTIIGALVSVSSRDHARQCEVLKEGLTDTHLIKLADRGEKYIAVLVGESQSHRRNGPWIWTYVELKCNPTGIQGEKDTGQV